MRVAVIGGGLAGTLLAWRLTQRRVEVLLAPGPAGASDATAVSGGSVRAYEVDPAQRSLALDSMAELLSDARLAEWAGYTECGSVYLPATTAGLPAIVAELNRVLPESASLRSAAELQADGWAGLPADAVGVIERRAGFVSPDGLRSHLLADLVQRGIGFTGNEFVERVEPGAAWLQGARHEADVIVVAAGARSPRLLLESGLPTNGLTTKGIQYTRHRADGVWPTAFVDDLSDLFGRPVPGGVLLGLPTEAWGIAAADLAPDQELSVRAAELAQRRFPALQLHSADVPVTAVDCYAPDQLLALRPVAEQVFTFTGGSGGSVKTALAASDRAARVLSELSGPLPQPELERSVLSS